MIIFLIKIYFQSKDQYVALTFENDFGHMATAAVLGEAHSGRSIFGHFFEHCWPYVTKNTNNVGLQCVNCCWFISINQ